MQGSLALHRGALYVGREDKTARVRVHDLDGRVRGGGFAFRDARAGRSAAAGLAVDEDRRIWVADTPASRVRRFTLFGRELDGFGLGLEAPIEEPPFRDALGFVRAPVDVALGEQGGEPVLAVAGAGERRHAVQLHDERGSVLFAPRPLGDAHGRFRGVRGVAFCGRLLYVAEAGAARVQVFRDGAFHFAFSVPGRGAAFEPAAVAPLPDGRAVVACAGPASALLLVDSAGGLVRTLAEAGVEEGCVLEPNDVVVEVGESDRRARVAVVDRDGERVQVFTLEGRSYGAFAARA